MQVRYAVVRAVVAVVVLAFVVVPGLVSCGGPAGGGPAPSTPTAPATQAPSSTLTGTVTVDNFVVGPDERVECRGDVTIECQTATVQGVLYSPDAVTAGGDAADITVNAQHNVLVTGTIRAGDGADGAEDAAGGSGGSVTITSASGDITIGVGAAASHRAEASTCIASGNGGKGGDGKSGGTGGDGGSVTLECPNGTLTFHQEGLLVHIGNGGNGGNGVVRGDDLTSFEMPEQLPNAGGDSGYAGVNAADITGPELEESGEVVDGQPVRFAVFQAGALSGGVGGDAGAFYFGVDPDTGESTWPARAMLKRRAGAREVGLVEVTGAKGGNGYSAGGQGGDVDVSYCGQTNGEGRPGTSVTAEGGDGGEASPLHGSLGRYVVHVMIGGDPNWGVGGKGGKAITVGGDGGPGAAGGGGANGGDGGSGGVARAEGGDGGNVYAWRDGRPGQGGMAKAKGGEGGNGGDACSPPPAGGGGDGGKGGEASALGGYGGQLFSSAGPSASPVKGAGGKAEAYGGTGGDGGRGSPPGSGGLGGPAHAFGGTGQPDGETVEVAGERGNDGSGCSTATPTPTPEPTPTATPATQPTPTPTAGPSITQYQPLGAGNTWEYDYTSGTSTLQVGVVGLAQTTFYGQPAYPLKWTYPGGEYFTQYLNWVGNVLTYYGHFMQSEQQLEDRYIPGVPWFIGTTAGQTTGEQTHDLFVSVNGTPATGSPFTRRTETKTEGTETVVVPAGTFQAVKVITKDYDTFTETRKWYAEGVGLVKEVQYAGGSSDPTYTYELRSHTSTQSLRARTRGRR